MSSGTLFLPTVVRSSTSTSQRRPISSRPRFTVLSFASTVDARRSTTNLYEILRIEKTASQIEIKAAYRSLAKRSHPAVGSDGRDFMEIHDAYSTLSDPTARTLYDRSIGGSVRRRVPSEIRFQTRRWETDQCW